MTNSSKTAKPSGPKIVFFGSGPVAAESLRRLSDNFEIEAVVTKPSTTREMAAVNDARIYNVENRHELDALIHEKPFESEIGVLIDFGIIVSQKVIDYFAKGIINSHFSLLPEWRGADPITFSILSGQTKTGVSLMLLTAGMDEGPLLAQVEYKIKLNETTPTLTNELIALSNHGLNKIIPLWLNNETKAMSQEQVSFAALKTPTYSRKLTKQDGLVDFTKPATVLAREVRAFAGWPKSQAKLGNMEVILTGVGLTKMGNANPGQLIIEKKQLFIGTGRDLLEIKSLQVPGKKEMSAEAFLAGYRAKLV